jgi:ATP-dependent metalloprotease
LKRPSFLENNNIKDLTTETRLKAAFADGVMHSQQQNPQNKSNIVYSLFKFLMFITFLYVLINILFTNLATKSSISTLMTGPKFDVPPESVNIKFDDVIGLTEPKRELIEIVDFLKNTDNYSKMGARLPKGVLLVGPPGCGKTLLAKAIAGEAGVPFFQANGSSFDEMFVGVGAKRVRQLFETARQHAPCVIFIDEIDSAAGKRTASAIAPHANQTINQLLSEMDGFIQNEGIIVIGSTNRKNALDKAILRPGRFDSEILITMPDLNERIEMIKYYLDKVLYDPKNIDYDLLGKLSRGFTGADIANFVNQAAINAISTKMKHVTMDNLLFAIDRKRMGYGRTRLANEEQNKITAYHEAGHALVAHYTKHGPPLYKVSILARCNFI